MKAFAQKNSIVLHQPADLKEWQVNSPLLPTFLICFHSCQKIRREQVVSTLGLLYRLENSFQNMSSVNYLMAVSTCIPLFSHGTLLFPCPPLWEAREMIFLISWHRHRGAAPLYHTLLNGDTESGMHSSSFCSLLTYNSCVGVSIVELHKERFDAGRILKQTKYVCLPWLLLCCVCFSLQLSHYIEHRYIRNIQHPQRGARDNG